MYSFNRAFHLKETISQEFVQGRVVFTFLADQQMRRAE